MYTIPPQLVKLKYTQDYAFVLYIRSDDTTVCYLACKGGGDWAAYTWNFPFDSIYNADESMCEFTARHGDKLTEEFAVTLFPSAAKSWGQYRA